MEIFCNDASLITAASSKIFISRFLPLGRKMSPRFGLTPGRKALFFHMLLQPRGLLRTEFLQYSRTESQRWCILEDMIGHPPKRQKITVVIIKFMIVKILPWYETSCNSEFDCHLDTGELTKRKFRRIYRVGIRLTVFVHKCNRRLKTEAENDGKDVRFRILRVEMKSNFAWMLVKVETAWNVAGWW